MRRYIVVGTSTCCKSTLIAGKIGSSICVYCDECENVWDSVENAEDVNKAFYSVKSAKNWALGSRLPIRNFCVYIRFRLLKSIYTFVEIHMQIHLESLFREGAI